MSGLDATAVTALFEACDSAWRLEAQPTYAIPREQPNLARWRAGEAPPAGHNAAWRGQVRSWTTAGKTVGRVRLLDSPRTEYQRYQLEWSIPGNTAAGEVVYLVEAGTAAELGIARQDFWMFERGDDLTVVRLNFAEDGTLIDRALVDPSSARQSRAQLVDLRRHARKFVEYRDHEA